MFPQLASGTVTRAVIPEELRSAWHGDGWCVWRSAIPQADLLAASAALSCMAVPQAERPGLLAELSSELSRETLVSAFFGETREVSDGAVSGSTAR